MSAVPGLQYTEELTAAPVALALLLFDGFTGQRVLGSLDVSIAGQDPPLQKTSQDTFVFFNLPAGNYTAQVRSADSTPYYLPVDIAVAVPFAPFTDPATGQRILWPAYPDISVADRTKLLSDPAQPAAYRQQRQNAGLKPTPQYPFPPGTTLARGVVTGGTNPAPGVDVTCPDAISATTTDENGEFVLIFSVLSTTLNGTATVVASKAVTVTATSGVNSKSANAVVTRGTTVGISLQLTP